jgi:hypothetical protein
MIRRVAYDKIITAFREAGIKFAHKEVTVNVPSMPGDEERVKAVAGAAARASIVEPPKPATDDTRG